MGETIGIDLASRAEGTAACAVDWSPDGSGHVLDGIGGVGCDDAALLELCRRGGVEKVGVDAPLGWPEAFVAAVSAWATGDALWPRGYADEAQRGAFVFRETDHEVMRRTEEGGRRKLRPLSVSTDRIAYVTMRAACLLAHLPVVSKDAPRDGSGLVAETYPAGALHQWGLTLDDRGSYKGRKPEAVARRMRLLDRVAETQRVDLPDAFRTEVERSDHLLDALICAVVAQLVKLGHVVELPDEHRGVARVEGWIHLPRPSSPVRTSP